jgi:hypothetical protein
MARAIAFIDILGFKNLLTTEPMTEIARKYEWALSGPSNKRWMPDRPDSKKLLPNHKSGDPWCFRHVFSDSIILIALDDSDESCLKLLLYCREVFTSMLTYGLAVRGAVTAGDLYYNPGTSVTLGKALTDAYLIEQEQDWAGICIADSVWDSYPSLRQAVETPDDPLSLCFLEYQPPWKRAPQAAHRIINWRFNIVVVEGTRHLLQQTRLHEAPSKYENVVKYLRTVVASGRLYFTESNPPPFELPLCTIGPYASAPKKPDDPMPPHGDDL